MAFILYKVCVCVCTPARAFFDFPWNSLQREETVGEMNAIGNKVSQESTYNE